MTGPSSRRRAPNTINYWLMKSEPTAYSIDDFAEMGRDLWDGIRNYQARNIMRDEMVVGDLFFFYHSSCAQPAIVGIGEISGAARTDPTQFDPQERYYDPKSDPHAPRWLCVEVKFISKAATPVTLAQMRLEPRLAGLSLLARGNRLSIQPVATKHWRLIESRL